MAENFGGNEGDYPVFRSRNYDTMYRLMSDEG